MSIRKDKIRVEIKDILLKEKIILFVYLHGSFIFSEEFNDVDIAVYLKPERAEHFDIVNFECSLSLKIEKVIKLPVDIKVLNFAPLPFKYQAGCGSLLFSIDELKRENFLCKTWAEYFDSLPLYRTYLKEVLNA